MPRHRIYESDAERQAAYRRRKALPAIYALAEQQATLAAAWELCDAVNAAADRGDSEAVRLKGLTPSQTIAALVQRFNSR
jgi:hypothetical protein